MYVILFMLMRMKTLGSEVNNTREKSSETCTILLNEDQDCGTLKNKEPFINNIANLKVCNCNDASTSRNNNQRNECLDENKLRDLHLIGNCDNNSKLSNRSSSPQSPGNDVWFNTWPERYDRLKSNDSSPNNSPKDVPNISKNTHISQSNCNVGSNNVKNKFTFNEALQNISLAYSPITKQLHIVEKSSNAVSSEKPCTDSHNIGNNYIKKDLDVSTGENNCLKKIGHRRIQAGSFSSTVSTISSLSGLSDPSPSGSLLGSDDRSLHSFNISTGKARKKSITNFFTRNF